MHKLIILLFAVTIGLVIAFWDVISPPIGLPLPSEVTAENRALVPDFTFTDLNAMEHEIAKFKGKTVMINVWASWCPPCIYEIPQLVELARRSPDDLIFIGLSVDDKPEPIGKFLNSLPKDVRDNVNLKNVFFVHDKNKAISKDILGITKYPETLVVDKNGRIKAKIEGVDDWLGPEIKALLED